MTAEDHGQEPRMEKQHKGEEGKRTTGRARTGNAVISI